MEQAQDRFSTCVDNFAKKIDVQPDVIPMLFPFHSMENAPSDVVLGDPEPSSDHPSS